MQTKVGLIVPFLILFGACSRNAPVTSESPQPAVSPASSPAQVAIQTDAQLAQKLDELLKQPEFSPARWGVAVLSLDSGKLVYQHDGNKLFTPASNMKLYTTAVALDLLGADYSWRTSIYADSELDQNGVIKSNLILYGRGAPDLTSLTRNDNRNSLEELVNQLQQRGVKQINGDVIGDESYFRGDAIGQGWQWNDLQWYFGAEASALTINGNSIDISVTSADKLTDQPTIAANDRDNYFQISNDMKTVASGSKLKIGVHKGITDNNVRVWGEFPIGARGYGVNLSVHRPSLWAARLLVGMMKSKGISVTGSARWEDSRKPAPDRFNPDGKKELAGVSSKSLAEIVRTTNKLSVNLYAELILRTLARERQGTGSQADDAAGRELGHDEIGCTIIRKWLAEKGVDATSMAFHDGSGLSRLNVVSPIVTTQLLSAISRTKVGPLFLESLPMAGKDGTLGGRLASLSDRVQAKTGTLTYDNSLSGYLTDATGKKFAFSVICNDSTRSANANRLIDTIVTTIAGTAETPRNPPNHQSKQ